MENRTKSKLVYFCFFLIAVTSVVGGGYFIYVSALVAIVLFGWELWYVFKKKKIIVAFDANLLVLLIFTGGYVISTFWALDSGMALMGAVKFIPLPLFFLLLCQVGAQKEEVINLLPLLGTLITVFSFVMKQFSAFESTVSVAGRLAGFFQYPNTYALFMLICMIIAVYRTLGAKDFDLLNMVYMIVSVFGIYMSGSRTVFVLTVLTIFMVLLTSKVTKRTIFLGVGACVIIVVVLVVIKVGGMELTRLRDISLKSSTFLGRLLYAQDALPVILKHPLGLGYYGYYFIQQEIQTGVYSVMNVHNELLQIMLDIGIIPAVLFYGMIIKSIFSTQSNMRNKMVLIVILLHSLFDYDFQFLSICFVLLLFLNLKNQKEVYSSVLFRVLSGVAAGVTFVLSMCIGGTEFFFTRHDNKKSLKFYRYNTMAKIAMLEESETAQEMLKMADSILEVNGHVPVAYSAKARVAFSKGNVEELIKSKLTAIRLAPYQFEEYLDYLDMLIYCAKGYIQEGDKQSAETCIKRAEAVSEMLSKVKAKTSKLGWEIKDSPQVTLPYEYLSKIQEVREKLDE